MPTKLFGTTDRDAAHAKLAEILAAGTHPRASCREDPNDPNEPFTVWDGPDHPDNWPPRVESKPVPVSETEEQTLDRLADKLLARLRQRGAI